MKTIFIAGGAGFLGSNFIHYLLDKYRDYNIVNFDKLAYTGRLSNVDAIKDSRYSFIHGDITKLYQIFDAMPKSTDTIINFVDDTVFSSFLTTNVFGTFILLEAAKKRKIEKFIQISTNDVYSNEIDVVSPHNVYLVSKISADLLTQSYYNTSKLPITILRCSNIFGPYQLPNEVISAIITSNIKKEGIKLSENESTFHDWLHVLDFCRALDTVLHYGIPNFIYNIGGWNIKNNSEVVNTISNFIKISPELIEFSSELSAQIQMTIDFSEITSKFNWRPIFTFEDGIRDTVEWYIENHKWWEQLRK